ncbi:hypothetical protein ACTMTJ_12200 [Phytohabitans sp. LJ34]|uniref:hypothetical protein n=1 Tax=Phytohabitans sp. LJ34 TaxID=3452217 RepID=UPI003F8B82C5
MTTALVDTDANPASGQPSHHPSHSLLLDPVVSADYAHVDAILVPTARPSAYLRDAMSLAMELGCPVVALCSKWAHADRAFREARGMNATLIAADVPEASGQIPLKTSVLLAGTKFARSTDVSLKRNLGLALARMVGWDNVVFLDDDITDIRPDDMRSAAALLSSYSAVGLENVGFPDNSVVCHAYRAVGEYQDSFVGGGAMAVPGRSTSFFPNIYNEDWFFLLDDTGFGRVAVTGKVAQKEFDPFSDPRRARAEELGDCLAEGVYALLDDGKSLADADEEFWRGFLHDRYLLIQRVLEKVPGLDMHPKDKIRMVEALKAAQGRRQLITPAFCVEYLDAWQADRKTWRDYVLHLPTGLTPRKALEHLGLSAHIALTR